MNGFSRTLVYGLAALCVVFISGVATGLVVLRSKGLLEPSTLRAIALSKPERDWLDAMGRRAPEKAPSPMRGASEEEVIEHIAELANADRASRLVGEIKLQKQALDERGSELERQWSEYRLAKADLARLQTQLKARQDRIEQIGREQEAMRASWAAAKLSESNWQAQLSDVEQQRYQDQAKLFEQMKDQAWPSLRRFDPREIARYLALMDPKRAARVLVVAEADPDYRDIIPSIHREMIHVDVHKQLPAQADRLAGLYVFMSPEAVLPYLRDSAAEEIADILAALQRLPSGEKKTALLLEALRIENSNREMEVRRALATRAPAAAAGPAETRP